LAASVQVVPATLAHAEALAPHLRAEDAAECAAALGTAPLEALRASLAASRLASAVLFDGTVSALCGVADTDVQRVGCVWALTGQAVDAHPRAFWRLSRDAVADYLQAYDVLFNFVDARYTRALRWVAALGFSVQAARPYGAAGLPFHPVVLRRP
jgi:hypothetical protein